MVKAEEEFVKRARETLEKSGSVDEQVEQLRKEFVKSISQFEHPKRGRNSNGDYWIYANGMAGATLIIPKGAIDPEYHFVFPVAFANDNVQITFSGGETPRVVKVNKNQGVLALENPNTTDIVMNVLGPRSSPD